MSRAGSATCSTSRRSSLEKVIYFAAHLVTWVDTERLHKDLPSLEAEMKAEIGDVEREREVKLRERDEAYIGELEELEGRGAKKNEIERAEKAKNKDFEDIRLRYEEEIGQLKLVWDTLKHEDGGGGVQVARGREVQHPGQGPCWKIQTIALNVAVRLTFSTSAFNGITFVLLFLMFGSVVVPSKALVLNLLSLTATFGAMVWIFQEGHLSGLLGLHATGTLDTTTPILMFCIAFGLSMDYEVFLLSRIKEEHDRTGDNDAVGRHRPRAHRPHRHGGRRAAVGGVHRLRHVGRPFIKLFGLGLALAVLMDATHHPRHARARLHAAGRRRELVGARWLRRIHDRIGFHEGVDLEEPGPAVPDGPGPVDLRPPDGVARRSRRGRGRLRLRGRVGVR